ncbi:Y-family DNA polymerase [Schaalia sp. lx-260]|uniref:Y-family DNA polymerase n=1 Tax=Schaalia sp. lx-260 TaxID=2899082 RepID=UPI001E3552D8|nr:hypothetical protein [Schaalia sp. lx-260]
MQYLAVYIPNWNSQCVSVDVPPDSPAATVKDGLIVTVNHIAQRSGLRMNMPIAVAQYLCPHTIFLSDNPERPGVTFSTLMNCLQDFVPQVRWIDVGWAYALLDSGTSKSAYTEEWAAQIGQILTNYTHVPCYAGIGTSIINARLAAHNQKASEENFRGTESTDLPLTALLPLLPNSWQEKASEIIQKLANLDVRTCHTFMISWPALTSSTRLLACHLFHHLISGQSFDSFFEFFFKETLEHKNISLRCSDFLNHSDSAPSKYAQQAQNEQAFTYPEGQIAWSNQSAENTTHLTDSHNAALMVPHVPPKRHRHVDTVLQRWATQAQKTNFHSYSLTATFHLKDGTQCQRVWQGIDIRDSHSVKNYVKWQLLSWELAKNTGDFYRLRSPIEKITLCARGYSSFLQDHSLP